MPTYSITIASQEEFDSTIADLCLTGGRQADDVKTPGEFAHAEIVAFLYHRRVQAAQIRAANAVIPLLVAVQSEITSEVTS